MDSKGQNQCTLKGIFGRKTQKFEQIWKPTPIYICPICQNSVLDSEYNIQYICKYEEKNRYVEVFLIKMKVEMYTYISYSCS